MVYSYRKLIYVCKCDRCDKEREVEADSDLIYNSAQAVRSIGWSFSRDGEIKCDFCRRRYVIHKGFINSDPV